MERVSFELHAGRSLGIVGESGCGKTATVMLGLFRLLPAPGRIVGGHITFEGRELLDLPDEEMRRIRGARIALIPQNPGARAEPGPDDRLAAPRGTSGTSGAVADGNARDRIVEVLDLTGIPDPQHQLDRYPLDSFFFLGGMKQRILIAMAIANHPALLVADEPTTALDTTMQAKVLEPMSELFDSSR